MALGASSAVLGSSFTSALMTVSLVLDSSVLLLLCVVDVGANAVSFVGDDKQLSMDVISTLYNIILIFNSHNIDHSITINHHCMEH